MAIYTHEKLLERGFIFIPDDNRYYIKGLYGTHSRIEACGIAKKLDAGWRIENCHDCLTLNKITKGLLVNPLCKEAVQCFYHKSVRVKEKKGETPKYPKESASVAFRVSLANKERIASLAKARGVSKQELLTKIIGDYLNEL